MEAMSENFGRPSCTRRCLGGAALKAPARLCRLCTRDTPTTGVCDCCGDNPQRPDLLLRKLPDGRKARLTQACRDACWRVWCALAAVCGPREEGVQIVLPDENGTIATSWGVIHYDGVAIFSVDAPQWEAHQLLIHATGEVEWASEQSAPDLPLLNEDL